MDLDEEGRSRGGKALYDARLERSVWRGRATVSVDADEEMETFEGFEIMLSGTGMSGRGGAADGDSGKSVLHLAMPGSGILGSCMISSDNFLSRFKPKSAGNCCLVGEDDAGVVT